MTVGTFFISITITALILLFIRLFWIYILLIGIFLYCLGVLTFISLVSAIIWAAFVSQTIEGWPWLWLYFFITYFGIVMTYALIVADIFDEALSWVKNIFRQ
jgi:hypothetical protein